MDLRTNEEGEVVIRIKISRWFRFKLWLARKTCQLLGHNESDGWYLYTPERIYKSCGRCGDWID